MEYIEDFDEVEFNEKFNIHNSKIPDETINKYFLVVKIFKKEKEKIIYCIDLLENNFYLNYLKSNLCN
jgi:hypothetical protein